MPFVIRETLAKRSDHLTLKSLQFHPCATEHQPKGRRNRSISPFLFGFTLRRGGRNGVDMLPDGNQGDGCETRIASEIHPNIRLDNYTAQNN
ncbi:hypothetical protein JTE90_026188 [Oedothorax gibbosus]|uniref:Uncharacterized protein n=1 Tax=Oedothorax gibbosus TaxID=931172 RepID=A0AAV6U0T4_9ARAC|nr:hypothetical protein JTE90_026188 [Oedothorax gibbosus]